MPEDDIWKDDRLGYKTIGLAFTNLVRTIDTDKVLSIEAGFGHGKTFFRKAWAKQLRSAGEVVVEVDVQQSDHSGDPVITLLGAMVGAMPREKKGQGEKALASATKVGAIGVRALGRAFLKSGADEIFEALTDSAIDHLEDFDLLDGVISNVGSEMSKLAGQLIASQMAAERVRKTELPEQLDALREALTASASTNRVVVLIDELDRCHPEYAISFLEATKLIFGQSGFVFCLMVNANYLENLAKHRFGAVANDEKYLDKFVDLRLNLISEHDTFEAAVKDLARQLPLKTPYGDHREFTVERAAELAGAIAVESGFSFRKVKRILLKVEVALRCYADQPLDAPLLVYLAFTDEMRTINGNYLPRAFLTPEEGQRQCEYARDHENNLRAERTIDHKLNTLVAQSASELLTLPADRYESSEYRNYKPWALAFISLAPHYIPSHRKVLASVAAVVEAGIK